MEQASVEVQVDCRITDEQGWRWYQIGDRLYASVTNVLKHIVHERKQNYHIRTSEKKQARVLKETGDFGTLGHEIVERDLKGLPITIPLALEEFYESWKRIKKLHDIRPIHSEKVVYSPKYGYAGTADVIGYCDGEPCIMDLKTGYYSVTAGWQIAAYKYAYEEMTGDVCGMVGIQIHRDGGEPKLFVYEHYEFCMRMFLASLETFKGLYFGRLQKMAWPWLTDCAFHEFYEVEK